MLTAHMYTVGTDAKEQCPNPVIDKQFCVKACGKVPDLYDMSAVPWSVGPSLSAAPPYAAARASPTDLTNESLKRNNFLFSYKYNLNPMR